MAGVRKKPRTKGGKYQGWFINASGESQHFTGTTGRTETLIMARRLEDDHRQVRLGYRAPSTTADRSKTKRFADVSSEYLDWGESQGGLGGRPWGEWHARKRRTHLRWWETRLHLGTLADFDGLLPRAEKELRGLQAAGKAGKTITNYAEALTAFCDWCVQRGYLDDDPLKALGSYDTTPLAPRRAMTDLEIIRLLDVSPPHRRLLYETAFLSGLRAKELRCLTQDHLDEKRLGLNLDAAWTKNRKPGFQHLSAALVAQLRDFADEGVVDGLYQKYYARRDANRQAPENALLFVPSSLSRDFDKDLKVAGVPKSLPAGKLDFHAIRLAYINLVLDSDATAREAQAMARHSTPNLTFNVYGRARPDRMAEVVEQIATRLRSVPDRVPSVYRQTVAPERENATTVDTGSCVSRRLVEPRGIEPLTS